MCGIAGAVGPLADRLQRVRVIVDLLLHRGPDEGGQFDDAQCSLAMRRLSIIDVAGGHQPIYNEGGDVVCICNGELYNYQAIALDLKEKGHVFSTKSDVEVAVHGYETWGDDFVSKINGMFALALWDARQGRLLLARDRVGKKPLYYTCLPGGLAFASELRSLLALPDVSWTVDREACRAFCLLGYFPADHTPIAQIRKVPPGHLAVWSASGLTMRGYWEPDPTQPSDTEGEAARVLLDLLRDSVRLRLISDVPVGAFLSGGLDSSLVVGIAAGALGATIPTYSVSFPGFSDHDEGIHARRVAEHFGCQHHDLPVDASQFKDLDGLVWALDEPLADPAALPTLLLSRAARKEVTVALTGEGADEVFGGYERYWLSLHGATVARRVRVIGALAGLGLRIRGTRAQDDSRWSRFLRAAAGRSQTPIAWSRAIATVPGVAWAAGWLHDAPNSQLPIPSLSTSDGSNRLLALQLDDLHTMLANGLLTKVDRMTMAASLEARCPFLDYRIVNFGLGLPDSWKIRGHTGKAILRKVAADLLPADIYQRPKHTFRVPISQWLRGPLANLAQDAASSPILSRLGVSSGARVRQLVDDHTAGRSDFSRALWALITLHLWFTMASQYANLDPSE